MGWMQPAQIPPKCPLSHVSQCLALSLQRHPAKRKQALDVFTSGGTSISYSETYIPDCPPWRPAGQTVAPAQPVALVSFLKQCGARMGEAPGWLWMGIQEVSEVCPGHQAPEEHCRTTETGMDMRQRGKTRSVV